jgi:hypothetical protein
MKLERLLKLAGVELSESTLARYNEPKANHTKKLGGEEKTCKCGPGTSTNLSKYNEPKANHKVKACCPSCGGKIVKEPKDEIKPKVPSTGRYKDHNSTK